jgi:hypothetical protein
VALRSSVWPDKGVIGKVVYGVRWHGKCSRTLETKIN